MTTSTASTSTASTDSTTSTLSTAAGGAESGQAAAARGGAHGETAVATVTTERVLAPTIVAATLMRDAYQDVSGVTTSRAYVVGGLLPSVADLAGALRALRATGQTEDVVGFAIPLEGDDPDAGIVRELRTGDDATPRKRGFDLMRFLAVAMDPHGDSRRRWQLRWAPGRNVRVAVEVLGDLTRWLVGIHAFKIHDARGEEDVWVLGRPNHAAAMHKLAGDAREGARGVLATLAVPGDAAAEVGAALTAGYCLLTTCETDENRMKRDLKILRRAGAIQVFGPVPLDVHYGVRPA
jgi:hypothetical protein